MISQFQEGRCFQLNPLESLIADSSEWNEIYKKTKYYQRNLKGCIINSITKSYILNIKIRPLVTEYALTIKLVAEQVPPTRLILMRTLVTRGLILIFKIYD